MERDQAKDFLKGKLEEYLKLKGINPRKNFNCLSPNHNDRTPSMGYNREALNCHCFSCGASYDIFDIVGLDYGLQDFKDQLSKAAEIFGVSLQGYHQDQEEWRAPVKVIDPPAPPKPAPVIPQTANPDFTEEVEKAHLSLLANPQALEKLKARGISEVMIERYRLGYAPGGYMELMAGKGLSGSAGASDYKIILPFTAADGKPRYFLAEIWDREPNKHKYHKPPTGEDSPIKAAPIFNERYIESAQKGEVIFITEGIYDALSIEETGHKAIALTGLYSARFIDLCKQHQPQATFIVSLDNDEPAKQPAEKLGEALGALGIRHFITPVYSPYKDPNEALQKDRDGFRDYVAAAAEQVTAEEKAELEDYINTSAATYVQGFLDQAAKNRKRQAKETGFYGLDDLLDGGLFPGLYVVGAISSLGKTTFCIQMMDNLAAAGHDVLIFSLEMARYEIMAKSVSRYTFLADTEAYQTTVHAKTTRALMTGKMAARTASEQEKEQRVVMAAVNAYRQIAGNIHIHEGMGNIGVEEIRREVEKHIRLKGAPPVVLVDYLQILAPADVRATDKQNTDKAVLELKRLSRDYETPVVCISSFNRLNYTAPVNMASFKESGAVEYSSDVLIALQYSGMDREPSDTTPHKREARISDLIRYYEKRGREGKDQQIQLKVLKNRNGRKGAAEFSFYPMFNYFADLEELVSTQGDQEQAAAVTESQPAQPRGLASLPGFSRAED
jgi:replicative DNA helicase